MPPLPQAEPIPRWLQLSISTVLWIAIVGVLVMAAILVVR